MAPRRSWEERILATVRAHEPISCAALKNRLGPRAKGRERIGVLCCTRWDGLSEDFAAALYGLICAKQLWVSERHPYRISERT